MTALRRAVYFAMLLGIGGAGLVDLVMTGVEIAMRMAGVDPLRFFFATCPVPAVCLFHDPVMRILEFLVPFNFGAPGADTRPNIPLRYLVWHGPIVVYVVVAALALRRVRAFVVNRSIEPPASFGGFAFGLAIVGLVLVACGYSNVRGLYYVGVGDPIYAGVAWTFLAFLFCEIGSFASGRAAHVKPPPRRRPIFGVIALCLLVVTIALPFAAAIAGQGTRDGFAALALMSLSVVGVAILMAAAAVLTLIAMARRERWIPAQVLAFVVTFGIGVPMILHLVR